MSLEVRPRWRNCSPRVSVRSSSLNRIVRTSVSSSPDQWDVVGDFYSEEPYGMAMRKGDAKFKQAVDAGLRNGFESGKYFEIYDKWFGPKGEVPYPLTPPVKAYLLKQIGK